MILTNGLSRRGLQRSKPFVSIDSRMSKQSGILLKSEGRCRNANIHFEVGLFSKTSSNHLTSDNFTLVQIKEINLRHGRGES